MDFEMIISATSENLVERVNNKMAEGYQPVGGVQIIKGDDGRLTFYLAMISPPRPMRVVTSDWTTVEAAALAERLGGSGI